MYQNFISVNYYVSFQPGLGDADSVGHNVRPSSSGKRLASQLGAEVATWAEWAAPLSSSCCTINKSEAIPSRDEKNFKGSLQHALQLPGCKPWLGLAGKQLLVTDLSGKQLRDAFFFFEQRLKANDISNRHWYNSRWPVEPVAMWLYYMEKINDDK